MAVLPFGITPTSLLDVLNLSDGVPREDFALSCQISCAPDPVLEVGKLKLANSVNAA